MTLRPLKIENKSIQKAFYVELFFDPLSKRPRIVLSNQSPSFFEKCKILTPNLATKILQKQRPSPLAGPQDGPWTGP